MPALVESSAHSHLGSHSHLTHEERHAHNYDKMDLVESLLAEIEDGEYLCLVCADDLNAQSEIWSCEVCYRVYHLPCIRKWAEKSLDYNDTSSSNLGTKTWKCPSCSSLISRIPSDYRCWCKRR